MFKIGDFSKIAQVSSRMLRHYDEIGLFRPEHTDEATGYRYYSARQLPQLNRIVSLRMLDFSLEEIRTLLQDELSAGDIRALYRANKAKLETHLRREQVRLRLLETRLEHLDSELAEAVLKPVPTQRILSLREVAPDFGAMGTLIAQTRRAAGDLAGLGPSLALFHAPDFETERVDWELGFVVEGDVPGSVPLEDGRYMTQRDLAGLELAASSMYEGDYLGLHAGYSALGRWAEANGYAITGSGREVFWHLDVQQPGNNVTELLFPVRSL